MLDRIRQALNAAGLPEQPETALSPLADCGLDSLIQVMSIIEFEKIFGIKIAAKDFHPESFKTLTSLETFLKAQGAK